MGSSIAFCPSLVRICPENDLGWKDVATRLAACLHQCGFVKRSFAEAIIDREERYPTALDAGAIKVAVPHCDPEHVSRAAICIGVLRHPVAWHRMDDPEATCPVSVVIMLALREAHAHLEVLQSVIESVRDQTQMQRVLDAENEQEAYDVLSACMHTGSSVDHKRSAAQLEGLL